MYVRSLVDVGDPGKAEASKAKRQPAGTTRLGRSQASIIAKKVAKSVDAPRMPQRSQASH